MKPYSADQQQLVHYKADRSDFHYYHPLRDVREAEILIVWPLPSVAIN